MAGEFFTALTKSLEDRRKRRGELEDAIALLTEKEKLSQQYPSASEKLNRLIFGLSSQAIPRQSTTEEAQAAIPSEALSRSRFPGMQTVPGPEGGIVMGQGEVAPGMPSAAELLLQRLGHPRAQQAINQQRTQAMEGLKTLGLAGVGRLSSDEGFPGTSTQRRELQISQDFEAIRQAITNGQATVQEGIEALVRDYPELSRKRGTLLEELSLAVGTTGKNVRR